MLTELAPAEKRFCLADIEPAKEQTTQKTGKKNGGYATRHHYFEGLAAICMPATT